MVSAGSDRFRESQPVNAKGQFWPGVGLAASEAPLLSSFSKSSTDRVRAR
jgi:hypothetical protein